MEYLVSKKVETNHVYYLVKWSGRQHRENSWVLSDVIKKEKNGNKMISDLERDLNPQEEGISKKRGRKIQPEKFKKRTVQLGELQISLPSVDKNCPHWMYGDQVEKIISRDDSNSTYKVLWNNGMESVEEEGSLMLKEPKLICQFFEGILNIKV